MFTVTELTTRTTESNTPVTSKTNKESKLTANKISLINNLTSKEDLLVKELSEIKLLCISLSIALGICFVCLLVFSIFCWFYLKQIKRKLTLVPEIRILEKLSKGMFVDKKCFLLLVFCNKISFFLVTI